MKSIEQLAESTYAAYCKSVGGTTFDGKPLPTFQQLGERQQAGWVDTAQKLRAEIQAIH